MIKIRPPHKPPDTIWLGECAFHDDQIELAGAFEFFEQPEDFDRLDDVFAFELDEIVAAMWTFDQGLLTADIFNSRMAKFKLEKVWRAKYLVEQFEGTRREEFCRAVHLLNRLKP